MSPLMLLLLLGCAARAAAFVTGLRTGPERGLARGPEREPEGEPEGEPGPGPTEPRFVIMPDGAGHLHLVDLWETEPEPQPRFDGPKDVELRLYTRNNPTIAEIIRLDDPSSAPSFNPKHQTRFVIHGWNSGAKYMDHIRTAYIGSGASYNVVMVDWSGRASTLYSSAKKNALQLGEYLALILGHLVAARGLNLDDVTLVGHSLGAHAAGVAGERLGGRVGRIVGLDAAAVLFGSTPAKDRLDPSDAQLVQAIHTDAGSMGLGWASPLGHADFYPNGGSSQPGCGLDLGGACSHSRSHEYYAESIISKAFVGTLCDSYKAYTKGSCTGNPTAPMGEMMPKGTTGVYYLKTNKKSPYAQG